MQTLKTPCSTVCLPQPSAHWPRIPCLSQLQEVTHLDKSTFRRRENAKARLRSDESDRLVGVARIAALAIETMGPQDGVRWLHESNHALGGRVPIPMLKTEVGARQVEDILTRIQHGIYS